MAIYSLSDNRDVSAHSNFAQNLMHHACNAEYNVHRIIFDPKILNTLRFFFVCLSDPCVALHWHCCVNYADAYIVNHATHQRIRVIRVRVYERITNGRTNVI